jgi:hypothetical protein
VGGNSCGNCGDRRAEESEDPRLRQITLGWRRETVRRGQTPRIQCLFDMLGFILCLGDTLSVPWKRSRSSHVFMWFYHVIWRTETCLGTKKRGYAKVVGDKPKQPAAKNDEATRERGTSSNQQPAPKQSQRDVDMHSSSRYYRKYIRLVATHTTRLVPYVRPESTNNASPPRLLANS